MFYFWPLHIKNITYMWKRMTAFRKTTIESSLVENAIFGSQKPEITLCLLTYLKNNDITFFLHTTGFLSFMFLLMLNPGVEDD